MSDEASTIQVDHSQWQSLLNQYLSVDGADGINRFAYSAVEDNDKNRLKSYLESLSNIDPRQMRRPEQMAYWINLYNALTVLLVLDHYPVDSIKKIRTWRSLFGPWDIKLVKIAGKSLSLNDIEHRILRPIWRDPRIHFAVNCASLGCPNLSENVYVPQELEHQLEFAAKQFINHPRAVKRAKGSVQLSSLFDWYLEDFASSPSELISYLNGYLLDSNKLDADVVPSFKFNYDWALNQLD